MTNRIGMNLKTTKLSFDEIYAKRVRYSTGIFGGALAIPLFAMLCLEAVENVRKVEAWQLESTMLLKPAVFLYHLLGINGVWIGYGFFVFLAIGILYDGLTERHKLVKAIGKEKINEAIKQVNRLKREALKKRA